MELLKLQNKAHYNIFYECCTVQGFCLKQLDQHIHLEFTQFD